ncbi:MAG: ATPase with chaperone activity [Rubrivivax sp.]|nr:ATPase with chaperone activity [Rubrivivax sp.]
MSDDSQLLIPRSFIDLFIPPGKHKPTATREHIAQRYELCEDLAQGLVDTAQTQRWSLGITQADVLQTIARSLPALDLGLDAAECAWVLTRMAELLGDDRDR